VDFKFLFRSIVEHTQCLLNGLWIRVVELARDGSKWNVGVSKLLEILLVPFLLSNYCTSQTCILLRPCLRCMYRVCKSLVLVEERATVKDDSLYSVTLFLCKLWLGLLRSVWSQCIHGVVYGFVTRERERERETVQRNIDRLYMLGSFGSVHAVLIFV